MINPITSQLLFNSDPDTVTIPEPTISSGEYTSYHNLMYKSIYVHVDIKIKWS